MDSNRQSGELFSVPGEYDIVYTVSDGVNVNKNCSFRIVLKSEYLLTDVELLSALSSDSDT